MRTSGSQAIRPHPFEGECLKAQGTVFNAANNPFKKDLDLLKTDLQPGYGTPGGSVVVVIFSDFQCPY